MKDTAYTSIALPAHTDTTYFTDPAGLQMFHLLSHTDGKGGESLLVDGFHCAKTLSITHPDAYQILSNIPIQSHASGNEGIVLTPSQPSPVLAHHGRDSRPQDLYQVRWNNDDRAALPLWLAHGAYPVREWYDAAAKWNAILKSVKNEYWEQLTPGRPLST